MQIAPLPTDEIERVKSLHDLSVLDSPSEAEFDALAKVAAAVCGAPISLVSLVDTDRQWFKANQGLPEAHQTSRDVAFCSHAILGQDIFEITDASRDPRFADNPLVVQDPHIRFYAGAPLRLSNGAQVGTLCVIDRQPRALDAHQKDALKNLAIAVVKALESRRTAQLFAISESRFRVISDASPLGVFATDPSGSCTYTNKRWQEIYGLSSEQSLGDGWRQTLHPEDKATVFDEWQRTADLNLEFDLAFRVLRPDGTIRHLRSRSRSIEDDVGGRQGYVGTVEDITELRTTLENLAISEQRFSRLYESTPAMLHSIDAQGLLLTVSDRWLQVLGYQRSEVIGRRSTEFLTEASQAQAKVVLAEYFKEGRCDHIAYQMVTKAGAVVDVLLSAILERNLAGEPLRSMAIIEDVTERNAAMRESNALLDTIRSQFIMSITDAAGSIIEVNDAFCGISQFTRHELMGSNHRIVNSKNHSPAFFEDMWSTISSGLPWKGVICNRAKDGTLYWVDSVIAPLLGSNGKVERYVSIRRDVTERVKQSRAIEAANTRITLATDSGGIGIWDFDVTQGTLMWDDWMYRLYGADKDAGVGTYDLWARHLHPDDKAAAEQAVQSAINGPEGLDIEFRIIRPDGRICHLRGTAKVTRDRSGRATRMVGASWDVTKLRQLSAELAEQHELLQVTLQSIGDAVITTDAQQRITWLNPVAQRMTGWSPNDAIGVPLTEVFHIVNERTRAPVTSPIASCLELQRTVELSDHNLLVSRDGKEFSIEDTAAPIRNERGELLGAVLVFHDVTRQRQQQKQVERALSEKELLLKEVYHRVKNNLQVVQSLLSIQRRSLAEGPGRSVMDDSIRRVRAMALVHEKLYRSSNLSALSIKDYCVDLVKQIAEATGARSRGVQIRLDIADLETGLDSAIPFGLLVSELVGNSLKHGFPEGRTGEVLVKLVRSESGTGCTLTVADDGLGFPAPQTDVFSQGSMGLQLASSLAGQLGGDLKLDTSSNTLFRAELPKL